MDADQDMRATGPVGMDGQPVTWLDTSPADYDRRRAVRGYRAASADQPGLFTVATPTAPRKATPGTAELPGQLDIFGGEA